MREKRHTHNHNRPARGFDTHAASSARKAGGQNRKRANWRFFDVRHRDICPFEPHFRTVGRTGTIAGKHLRTVDEPVRANHGKAE